MEEVDESAERLMQYKAFLDSLFDKRKQLEKFVKGMHGLRETAIKQDRVLLKNTEDFFAERAKALEGKKSEELPNIKDLVMSLGMDYIKTLEACLKDRREIDKYFDSAVENFLSGITTIDSMIRDKIIELLQNIENTHTNELNRLKIQIADLVQENDELKREIEALKAGIPKKPKEIPEIPEVGKRSIQCPVCLQLHEVDPSVKSFKCPICSYEIKIEQ